MGEALLHVQIGPSPLALGLLVPATLAAGFDVCVVGPPGDDSPTEYVFSGSGPAGRVQIHQVDWFEGPRVLGDLPGDLRDRIASEEPLLITCTLRKKVAERRPFIEELLRARPANAETILLACENAPDAAYAEIAEACDRPGFRMLRTVVNRMCIRLDRDSENRRVVSAHPLGEWMIARPEATSQILQALATVDELKIVDDIEAMHDRKLWMVNGAHQALALIGRHAGVAELRIPDKAGESAASPAVDDLQTVARGREVLVRLSHLHGAMNTALHRRHPDLEDSLEYGYQHVCAYGEHPDSINRVLGAMKRSDLVPFIEALDIRLAEPARVCFEMEVPVTPFAYVFDVFEDLMGDLDAFIDADRVRRDSTLLSAEADRRALLAYAELVSGWTSKDEAIIRLGRFAKGLAISRPW